MNVHKVVTALGIDVYQQRGSELIALCPMHKERTGKEDNNPSWQINGDTGKHICFSCGYHGGLVSLVTDLKGFTLTWGKHSVPDYEEAKSWIANVADTDPEELLEALRKVPDYVTYQSPVGISEARLAVFDPVPSDVLSTRRLTAESAEHYGVLFSSKDKCWVLPIRDPHEGTLWGWQEKGTVDRTFKNRPPGVQKSKTLFGIEAFKGGTMVLVESPLDCLRLRSAGIEGGVAAFGALVSKDQIKLLNRADKVIVAMDNPAVDAAGKKACEQIMSLANAVGLEVWFFNYGDLDVKDVGDMQDQDIVYGVTESRHMIYGEAAYL